MKYENGRLTGLVTSYVETAFQNKLLKESRGRDGCDKKTGKKT